MGPDGLGPDGLGPDGLAMTVPTILEAVDLISWQELMAICPEAAASIICHEDVFGLDANGVIWLNLAYAEADLRVTDCIYLYWNPTKRKFMWPQEQGYG